MNKLYSHVWLSSFIKFACTMWYTASNYAHETRASQNKCNLPTINCQLRTVGFKGVEAWNIHIMNLNIWTSLYCRPPSQQADHIIIYRNLKGPTYPVQCHPSGADLGFENLGCIVQALHGGLGGFLWMGIGLWKRWAFCGKKAGLKKDPTKHSIQLN